MSVGSTEVVRMVDGPLPELPRQCSGDLLDRARDRLRLRHKGLYGLSGLRWAQERAYDLVAANRHRFPGGEPYCEQHPDECR